jgi:hypothetical protein
LKTARRWETLDRAVSSDLPGTADGLPSPGGLATGQARWDRRVTDPKTKRSLTDSDIATYQRRGGPSGTRPGKDTDSDAQARTDTDTAPKAQTDSDAAPAPDRDA